MSQTKEFVKAVFIIDIQISILSKPILYKNTLSGMKRITRATTVFQI